MLTRARKRSGCTSLHLALLDAGAHKGEQKRCADEPYEQQCTAAEQLDLARFGLACSALVIPNFSWWMVAVIDGKSLMAMEGVTTSAEGSLCFAIC